MPRQRAAAGSGPVSDAPAHRSTLRVHSRTSEQLLRPLCNRRRARSRVVQAVELVGETAEIVNGPGLRAGTEAQLRRQSARRRLPIRRARWPPGWCRGFCRLSLTEAGSDYYQRAMQVLALVEEAEHAATQEAAEPRGTLRVNTSVSFGVGHAGAAISAYLQRHPRVKVDLTLNDRVVDLVEEGFDVALRISSRIDPGLVARPITRARLVACAAPAYLARHGTPKSPADIARHNCLTYAYSGVQNEWQFTRRGRTQSVKVAGNLHGNNGDILASAAAAGLGITVQPSFMIHELLRGRKLVRVLPGWEMQALTVFAVYPSRQFLPPKVRSFIDFMVEYFGDEPYWDRDLP